MQRRTFFVITTSMLITPVAAAALQADRTYKVGLVFASSPVSQMLGSEPRNLAARVFVQELGALGYVEGRNLVLERRSAEGKAERFGDIIVELVRVQLDVIVTVNNEMTHVAKRLTTTVPIVMAASSEPAQPGLVTSLARPGGNITGLTIDSGPENEGKRLGLLREAISRLSQVAYLATEAGWRGRFGGSARHAARALGIGVFHAEHVPGDPNAGFAAISRGRAEWRGRRIRAVQADTGHEGGERHRRVG